MSGILNTWSSIRICGFTLGNYNKAHYGTDYVTLNESCHRNMWLLKLVIAWIKHCIRKGGILRMHDWSWSILCLWVVSCKEGGEVEPVQHSLEPAASFRRTPESVRWWARKTWSHWCPSLAALSALERKEKMMKLFFNLICILSRDEMFK